MIRDTNRKLPRGLSSGEFLLPLLPDGMLPSLPNRKRMGSRWSMLLVMRSVEQRGKTIFMSSLMIEEISNG
jgi:hypothetical protein